MSSPRAVDLPQIRHEVAQWLANGPSSVPFLRAYFGRSRTDPEIENLRQSEFLSMLEAELFYVAPSMLRLSEAASRTLPVFVPEPFDLPAEQGFMVFGEPVSIPDWHEVEACSWCVIPGEQRINFSLYSDHRQGVPGVGTPLALDTLLTCAYGVELNDDDIVRLNEWTTSSWFVKFMQATWLLMQQPLASVSEQFPDRAARKRLRRLNVEPGPVRVVELRRPKSDGTSSEGPRDWHHQWIVRGHWRQQWYPSLGVHRPVWIAPHVKGPEGAPLLGGEKVNAWVR